jgi:hypothetical protein
VDLPSKEDLLNLLNTKQLRELAKENDISLSIEGFSLLGRKKTRRASSKEDIVEILESKRRVTKDKIKDKIAGKVKTKVKSKILEKPLSKKAKERKKGHDFEDKVAKWAKKFFEADEVFVRKLRMGYTQKRPYEIDVHVRIVGGYIVNRGGHDIWIECKNLSETVKRTHIFKTVESVKDVNRNFHEGRSRESCYFDHVAVISTSGFDVGALGYATENDVACIHYDKRKFNIVNDIDWL